MHAPQTNATALKVPTNTPVIPLPHGLHGAPGSEAALEIDKIIGEAFSAVCDGAEIGVVNIPSDALDALQSWDGALANVDRQVLAKQFCRAAMEVLRFGSPRAEPDQWQNLVDSLQAVGE